MENLTKRLEEITINITDGKHGDCENQENSGYFFISCKDVDNGRIDYSNARQITKESFVDADKRTKLEVNDILITNSGTIGRMALMKSSNEYIRNTTFQKSVAIIKPNADSIYPEYLYYYLIANRIFLIELSNGVAQKNLLLSTLRDFKVTYPCSVEKQKSIANHISKYDELIEVNNQRIKKLEQTLESYFKLTYQTEIKNHKYQVVRLQEITEFVRGLSYSSEEIDCEDGINLINLKNIQGFGGFRRDGTKTYNGDYKKPQVVQANDLIMGVTDMTQDRRTVGSVALVPQLNGTNVISADLIKIESEIDKEFLYCLFRFGNVSKHISQFANGANVLHLKPQAIGNIKIMLPEESFIESFSKYARMIIAQIETLNQKNDNLIKQRDLLLPRLMSDKLEI